MNKIVYDILFGVLLFVVQILVFSNVQIPITPEYTIFFFIYPLIIFGLPIDFNPLLSILIAFVVGIGVDTYEDSLGVNAGALVLMAYIRPAVIKLLEPPDGYTTTHRPRISSLGLNWFMSYSAILLFVHILTYFILEYFSVVFVLPIVINTIISFIASWLILLLISVIFRR